MQRAESKIMSLAWMLFHFSTEHKSMLGNCKMLLERDGGYIAINPKFDKLITSLRPAVENDGML